MGDSDSADDGNLAKKQSEECSIVVADNNNAQVSTGNVDNAEIDVFAESGCVSSSSSSNHDDDNDDEDKNVEVDVDEVEEELGPPKQSTIDRQKKSRLFRQRHGSSARNRMICIGDAVVSTTSTAVAAAIATGKSRAKDLIHKCQSDPGKVSIGGGDGSTASRASSTPSASSVKPLLSRTLRSACSNSATTRKCVLTLDGYSYVIGKGTPTFRTVVVFFFFFVRSWSIYIYKYIYIYLYVFLWSFRSI